MLGANRSNKRLTLKIYRLDYIDKKAQFKILGLIYINYT